MVYSTYCTCTVDQLHTMVHTSLQLTAVQLSGRSFSPKNRAVKNKQHLDKEQRARAVPATTYSTHLILVRHLVPSGGARRAGFGANRQKQKRGWNP